jgi:hypothetical protein
MWWLSVWLPIGVTVVNIVNCWLLLSLLGGYIYHHCCCCQRYLGIVIAEMVACMVALLLIAIGNTGSTVVGGGRIGDDYVLSTGFVI